MIYHWAVYSRDPEFSQVLEWIQSQDIVYELHINRTRFWIPTGKLYLEFLLRFSHCCHRVDPQEDLALGRS